MQTIAKRRRAAAFPQPAHTTLEQAPAAAIQPPALRPAAPAPAPAVAPPSTSPTLDAHGHDPDAYDWVPIPRRRRTDGWSPEKQRAFIGYLADTGSVRLAAQLSGMSAQSAYRLRRAPEGAAFAAAWEAAIQQAAHALVDAAFERAVHGSEEPVWNRDGQVIGRRFRQSDAMMMFLLRKHFPDRYGDTHRDHAVPASLPAGPSPVADTLARLGPVPPADPAATVAPDMLTLAIARADNGWLPPDLQAEEAAAQATGLGPAFEAALDAAKAEAAPSWWCCEDDRDEDDWADSA